MSALEGGTETAVGIPGALAVASGQAAETLAILTICEAGDHIVASAALYGGTFNLLHYTLPKMGITVSFVDDPDDLDAWSAAVQDNTKAFFGETLPNPKNNVIDIAGIADIAHRHGVRSSSITPPPPRTSAARSSTAPTSSCTPPPSTSAVTAPRSAA